MTTRRVLILAAATALAVVAAAALIRPATTYFPTDGRTELGLPVPAAEPVLVGIELLVPRARDTVELRDVRPTVAEGEPPEILIYDPGPSRELVGMLVERDWHTPAGATMAPFASVSFTSNDPRQVVLRINPGSPQVTVGPVAVDFTVNGGAVQTQVLDVHARACFDRPTAYDCRPPAAPE